MQNRPKALALLLGLILVAQAAAFLLFHQSKSTALAMSNIASVQPVPNGHWLLGEHIWQPPPPSAPVVPPKAAALAIKWPSAPKPAVHGTNTGDFASCVRQKESSNNYAYSGYYHGAYNMTTSHWDGYGGYARPEDAPPAVQDAKFQSDVAQGSGYMHQQYPVTSRLCGM